MSPPPCESGMVTPMKPATTVDLEVIRLIIESVWSVAQAQSHQRISAIQDVDGEPSPRDVGTSAWQQYCARNMRNEEIEYSGHRWRVLTHLREGIWRIVRVDGGAVEDSVRLDWNGQVGASAPDQETA